MRFKIKFIAVIVCLTFAGQLFAQSLSTQFDHIEDYYRREQLLGNIGLEHSFASYPLFPVHAFETENPYTAEGLSGKNNSASRFFGNSFNGTFKFDEGKYILKILPVVWNNQFNSHHPEDWNDGSMIPAKGYQTRISAGIYFEYDHLSIKLQPEYIYAANKAYEGFPMERENPELVGVRWYQYYHKVLNWIDSPEKFGDNSYSHTSWGESSIRLTFNSVSLGLSNENLWWGPGMRNSLLMTNTASGFAHLTLNSVKPIKTAIGFFEGQIVAGWLENSGYLPPNDSISFRGVPFYLPRDDDEGRYFNGLLLNYQPKWIPGLHLGLIRVSQVYHHELNSSFSDFLPIFAPYSEKRSLKKYGTDGNYQKRDNYNSIFFRFIWPEAQLELYGEYGLSDALWDGKDLVLQMEHSNAYNFGLRKLFILKDSYQDNIQFGLEFTQLAKNSTSMNRNAESWYTSRVVRHGYTHKGQMLGAGIGPGGNTMTINLGWNKAMKSIGLVLERYVHNNDLFFESIKDVRMHWLDVSASLNGSWDYNNLLFNFRFKYVKSQNYQWVFDYNLEEYWDYDGANDVINFQGQLGVMYRF